MKITSQFDTFAHLYQTSIILPSFVAKFGWTWSCLGVWCYSEPRSLSSSGTYSWQGFSGPRVPRDTPGTSLIAYTLAALTIASELDKEPLGGRHASGRDKTLASELEADMLVAEKRP